MSISSNPEPSTRETPHVFAVILAGGAGTRLWPLSRRAFPKQFLALGGGGHTLLQDTFRRAKALVGTPDNVVVMGQKRHAALLQQQLPGLPPENIILEPTGCNTAASIGLAALALQQRSSEEIMVILPADHLFEDEMPWLEAVRVAVAFAGETDWLVAIGIPPEGPSSSYGYLRLGEKVGHKNGLPVHEVSRFVEKPDSDLAEKLYTSGDYLWNTGTFSWRMTVFLQALKQHMPKLHQGLLEIAERPERLREIYSNFESVSVDYGVMEKSSHVAAVQGSFKRLDLGSLPMLSEVWGGDSHGNAVVGTLVDMDSQNNIIYSDEGLVGLIGIEDMVVIRQGEVLLVCPKERAHEVKELVAVLGKQGLERYE
ncbi:MAG TPA: sugar phosphate nucleotidyltransferase [Anaerolineales bacterium]|nr:sugar phosphate nucleotidyltransferase [Anaerolineales bacterium]